MLTLLCPSPLSLLNTHEARGGGGVVGEQFHLAVGDFHMLV
jgi:hypothetical protein